MKRVAAALWTAAFGFGLGGWVVGGGRRHFLEDPDDAPLAIVLLLLSGLCAVLAWLAGLVVRKRVAERLGITSPRSSRGPDEDLDL